MYFCIWTVTPFSHLFVCVWMCGERGPVGKLDRQGCTCRDVAMETLQSFRFSHFDFTPKIHYQQKEFHFTQLRWIENDSGFTSRAFTCHLFDN